MPPNGPMIPPEQPGPQPPPPQTTLTRTPQQSTVVPPQATPTQPYPPNQAQVPVPPSAMHLNPSYTGGGLAIASLILGVVSLPASILNILSLPIPIVGIVLGAIGLKHKKSLAVAGIILSGVGIILSIVVLIVGTHIQHNKKASQSTSSLTHGVSGSNLSSTCYSFLLPDGFTNSNVQKNSDCLTVLVKADSTDDLSVNSSDLTSPVSDSERDAYLKNLVAEFQNQAGSAIQIKSTKFITLDGARAYEATGTENNGNYKYVGIVAVLAPKDYISVTGAKLRAFLIAYDSATSQDRLDKLAQSWHWQ